DFPRGQKQTSVRSLRKLDCAARTILPTRMQRGARAFAHPSVTGRSGSRGQPSISDVLLAGHSLLYGVGAAPSRARPPPDGVRKGQVDQSTRVVVISHKGVHGLTWSSSLGEGTSLREGWC